MFTYPLPEFGREVIWRYVYVDESTADGPSPQVFSVRRTGDYVFRGDVRSDHQEALGLVKFRRHQQVYDSIVAWHRAAGGGALGVYDARVRFEPDRTVRILELVPAPLTPYGRRPLAVE